METTKQENNVKLVEINYLAWAVVLNGLDTGKTVVKTGSRYGVQYSKDGITYAKRSTAVQAALDLRNVLTDYRATIEPRGKDRADEPDAFRLILSTEGTYFNDITNQDAPGFTIVRVFESASRDYLLKLAKKLGFKSVGSKF